MKNALNKDFIRDIFNSKGRFLSIVAIVALGVAFFTGIKSTPLVMKASSDKYYDDYNLMDIRLVSTLGLTDEDVDEIKKIKGVEGASPTYSIDVISKYKNNENVVKIEGLNQSNSNDKNYINQVKLIEGRLPNKSGECVLEKPKIKAIDYPIGSKIKLASGNDDKLSDSLKKTEYTVVGYVETPYYLSHEKGNTSIGSGVIEGVIMIPRDDFKMEAYTDIFLTVSDTKALDTYSDKYFDKVDMVTNELEDIKEVREEARYKEIVGKANKELQKVKNKLAEGKKELENGKKEYESNKIKIEKELKNGQDEINKYLTQIEQGQKLLNEEKRSVYAELEDGEKQIAQAEEDLKKGEEEYNAALTLFNNEKEIAEDEISKAEESLNLLLCQINIFKEANSMIEEQLKSESISDEKRQELEYILIENNGYLEAMETEYEEGSGKLQQEKDKLTQGEAQFESIRVTLENSKKQISDEKYKLIQAKDAAATQVADGQKEIDKIEKPTWYILDRNSHQSFVEYEGCAKSIDALAKIFPVFFFAVAALVCLTTMTRMVDEQRINIGTLKGLGYTTSQISKKYIFYALSACLIGSLIGIGIGFTVFPTIIYTAYGMMYSIPQMILIFSLPISMGITVVALTVITMAAYFACYKELKESPAVLMRPRAPKSGKRILIERIPFVWNRFSFISKVTVRNIFRYKKRFLMTVLGISGCTALILTGFGIKDSIETIVTGQYGDLFKYDMSIITKSDMSEKEINDIKSDLKGFKEIKNIDIFSYQNGDIKVNKTSKEITIVVPKNLDTMDNYIHLQDRKTREKINLKNDGVVITEKMAKDLGIKYGDTIDLINSNDKKGTVRITGITENYLSHYIYISKDYYDKVFNEKLDYNRALGILNNPSVKMEENLSKKLSKIELVEGVRFNTAAKETFHYTIKNLNYVVLFMIACAGALAFVVLYNLTNVNISERIREIATIKVLGFYDKEVSAYIYRENVILTLIGTVVGLGLGKILHQFIMVTVEIQSMMFGRVIDTSSYFIAAILTVVMSCFVNIAMFYKLKNVKMVESLKSVD